jgi:hypothetical protein
MAQVAIRANMASIIVDVHPCLCAFGLSLDSLLCPWGKEGSHLFDSHDPLPVVFLL